MRFNSSIMKGLVVALVAIVLVSSASARFFKPRLDGRIVGGNATTIEEYPYQISLEYYGSHRCGGSIVSSTVIVTAAHCVEGISASSLKIRAGTSTKGSGGVLVQVKNLTYHENYDYYNIDYDIAVLILAERLNFTKSIKTVPLPNANEQLKANTSSVITGWGTLSSGGSSPRQLQRVSVPIVDQAQCQAAYGSTAITPRMLCAGVLNKGGKDACQGDSGGPLVSKGKLFGVVSWGKGCANAKYPGVYTRVTSVRQWIKEKSGV